MWLHKPLLLKFNINAYKILNQRETLYIKCRGLPYKVLMTSHTEQRSKGGARNCPLYPGLITVICWANVSTPWSKRIRLREVWVNRYIYIYSGSNVITLVIKLDHQPVPSYVTLVTQSEVWTSPHKKYVSLMSQGSEWLLLVPLLTLLL